MNSLLLRLLCGLTLLFSTLYSTAQYSFNRYHLPGLQAMRPASTYECSDHGVLVGLGGDGGSTTTSAVVKINVNDSVLWNYEIQFPDTAGSPRFHQLYQVGELASGHYYVLGQVESSVFLFLFDPAGGMTEERYYDVTCFTGGTSDAKSALFETTAGQLLIVASCPFTNVILKTNATGDLIWSHENYSVSAGGGTINGGETQSIIEHSNGNIYATGRSSHNGNTFVYALDGNGTFLWGEVYTDQGSTPISFRSIIETQDGKLLIGGSHGFDNYGLLAKLETDGTPIWCNAFANLNINNTYYQLLELANGEIVAGFAEGASPMSARTTRFDANGTALMHTALNTNGWNDHILGLSLNHLGGYTVAAGGTSLAINDTPFEVFRTDSTYLDGNFAAECYHASSPVPTHSALNLAAVDTNFVVGTVPVIDTTAFNMTLTPVAITRTNLCPGTTITSIAELGAEQVNVKLWPNPAREAVTLQVDPEAAHAIAAYEIVSTPGRSISGRVPASGNLRNLEIPVAGLSSGIYLVTVYFNDAVAPQVVRFVKE